MIDPTTVEDAYRQVFPLVSRFLRKRLILAYKFTDAQALDVVISETLEKLFVPTDAMRLHILNGLRSPEAFIFTVAQRCAISHYKKSKRYVELDEHTSARLVDHLFRTPDEEFEHEKFHAALAKAISRLTTEEQLLIRLYSQYAPRDIAKMLGQDVASVRQQLWSVLRRLRRQCGGKA